MVRRKRRPPSTTASEEAGENSASPTQGTGAGPDKPSSPADVARQPVPSEANVAPDGGALADGQDAVANDSIVREAPSLRSWLTNDQNSRLVSFVGVCIAALGFIRATAPLDKFLVPVGLALVLAGLWKSWASKRRLRTAGLVALALILTTLMAGVEFAPSPTQFSYGSSLGPLSGNAVVNSGIVLTLDPKTGMASTTLPMFEPAELTVSCRQSGVLHANSSSVIPSFEWAKIVDGNYQGYWVPVELLYLIAPGKAHSLISCSDWRWRLQVLLSPFG